jgi:hypothetical protein
VGSIEVGRESESFILEMVVKSIESTSMSPL